MHILSIQVGKAQEHNTPDPNARINGKGKRTEEPQSQPLWTSGIFKQRVDGPRWLGLTNLDGDGQADTKNHGGADKAICVYAYEHYAYWQETFGLAELATGAFGENFTTVGLLENEVCIGDTFAVENAQDSLQGVVLQLSQARQPCWKLARRWQVGDMVERVQNTGFTGWYFRVLQEGYVEAGTTLHLTERPYPQFTLSEANRVMHHDKEDWDAVAALMVCPLLSSSWRNSLRRRINFHAPADVASRLRKATSTAEEG